jgi:hypothetical protein
MSSVSSDWMPFAFATVALALAVAPTHADPRAVDEHCTREDVQNAEPRPAVTHSGERDDESAAAAIVAETAHALPPVTVLAADLPADPRDAMGPTHFADRIGLIERLKSLRRLRLLRLWDSARITVFFGIDRKGVAGLHVQQQDPNDLPAARLGYAPLELPPLRAVPLNSL